MRYCPPVLKITTQDADFLHSLKTVTKKTDFRAIKEKQPTHLDNHRFGVTRQTFSLIYLQKFAQDDISRQEDYMLKRNNNLRSV